MLVHMLLDDGARVSGGAPVVTTNAAPANRLQRSYPERSAAGLWDVHKEHRLAGDQCFA